MEEKNNKKEVTVIVPKNLLFEEPFLNESILFLNRLFRISNKKVILDFSRVTRMRECDYMVLLAQVEKTKIEKKCDFFRGERLPESKKLKEILTGKKNIHHLNTIVDLQNAQTASQLQPKLINDVVQNLKTIGITNYFFAFDTFLNELMGNATEHGIERRNINWWLIQSNCKGEKKIRFVFLDMGIGIVGSHKKAGLPLKYLFSKTTKIVRHAFNGMLGSSTKIPNRGKGLPQLNELIAKGIVSDFRLTTNRVTLSYEGTKIKTKGNKNFVGTYYCWTVDKENYLKWKNTL